MNHVLKRMAIYFSFTCKRRSEVFEEMIIPTKPKLKQGFIIFK